MESYKRAIIGIAVLIAVATVTFFLFFNSNENKSEKSDIKEQTPITTSEKTKEEVAPEEKVVDPVSQPANPYASIPLNDSDTVLKEEFENSSTSKIFASILSNQDLLRRFTATVLNISMGKSPAKHLPFMKPGKSFSVIQKSGKPVLDIRSYKRYNFVASLFSSLDTEVSVANFHKMEPLFQKALNELGIGDKKFVELLQKAFTVLLKTPLVYGEIGLEKKLKSWEYMDSGIAKLNEAQKHLFRMGPDNIKTIHSKIREFGEALGFENLPHTKTYLPEK